MTGGDNEALRDGTINTIPVRPVERETIDPDPPRNVDKSDDCDCRRCRELEATQEVIHCHHVRLDDLTQRIVILEQRIKYMRGESDD